MEYAKYDDVTDEHRKRFNDIPFYPLGEAPDMQQRLYRCVLAKRALIASYEDTDANMPYAIIDALTDIRHLCNLMKIDFADLDNRAYQHYRGEINDPDFTKEGV